MKQFTAESLLEHGRQAKREHRLKYARSIFQKALDESRSSENRTLRGTLYAELAYVERKLGELEHSKTHYLLAAEACRQLDQPLRWVHNARHAADVLREQGRRDESGRLYAEVLETYRASQGAVRLDLANALRGYALLKGQTGAVEEACRLWREAGDLYHSENVDAGVDECAKQIAALQAT